MEITRPKEEHLFPEAVYLILVCVFCNDVCKLMISEYFSVILIHEFNLPQELLFRDINSPYFANYGHSFVVVPILIIIFMFLGKVRTTILTSVIYLIGVITQYLTIVVQFKHSEYVFIVAALMSINSSIMLEILLIFSGCEQFTLPDQVTNLKYYCSAVWFLLCVGSLVTPIFARYSPDMSTHQLDRQKLYIFVLNVGLASTLLCVYVVYKKYYKRYTLKRKRCEPTKCFLYALKHVILCKKKGDPKQSWLEHASTRFSRQTIDDLRTYLEVCTLMMIVFPFYVGLHHCQTVHWDVQAGNMNMSTVFGNLDYSILHRLLKITVVIAIPLFDIIIYPLFKKCKLLINPLQRMVFGGIFMLTAVVLCASVEFALRDISSNLPKKGEGFIQFFNGINCDVKVKCNALEVSFEKEFEIDAMRDTTLRQVPVGGDLELQCTVEVVESCRKIAPLSQTFILEERATSKYFFYTQDSENIFVDHIGFIEMVYRPTNLKLRVLYDLHLNDTCTLTLSSGNVQVLIILQPSEFHSKLVDIDHPNEIWTLYVCDDYYKSIDLVPGGYFHLIINKQLVSVITVIPPHRLQIGWLLPCYILLGLSEVLFIIPAIHFHLSQTPASLRLSGFGIFFINISIGHIIYRFMLMIKLYYPRMGYELLIYGGIFLVLLDTFIYLSVYYEYKTPQSTSEEYQELETNSSSRTLAVQ